MSLAPVANPAEPVPSPRREARRRAFIGAAAEVFAEKGYAEATLDDVIARSGGSRQTLYALFGGKQGLFEALIGEKCAAIFGRLLGEQTAAQPLEAELAVFGRGFLEVVTGAEATALYRLVIAEAPRIPEIAEAFWKQGPGRGRMLLAKYLTKHAERGVLRVADPEMAASAFLGMLVGQLQLQVVLGLRDPPKSAEIETIVGVAVTHFLDGCRIL